MNNTNLRIQFVRNRTFNKFIKELKNDNYLNKLVTMSGDNCVMFNLQSEEFRELCLTQFKKSIPSAKLKITAAGHTYLKVYK